MAKNKQIIKTEATQKEPSAIDPTIEQQETVKAVEANTAAMESKLAAEAVVEAQTNAMAAPTQVLVAETRKGTVTESNALIEATKADAKARGKTFVKCPVNGVLIVK